MYGTIVAATDGSPSASKAVAHAFELARQFAAKLHVVTAYRPLSEREVFERQRGVPPAARVEIDEAQEARTLLDRIAADAADAGVAVELYATVGEPGEVIVRLAHDVDADLIVVGNRGMTGARRLLGSVPNHVSHHAPCSVLVVRTT